MMYANHIAYSDVTPHLVIRRVSAKTYEIQTMKTRALHDPEELGWLTGGFSAMAATQHKQRWEITPNPHGEVRRIRLHKDGRWRDKHGEEYALSEVPRKYYDYNF